jgi:hypothetical protein
LISADRLWTLEFRQARCLSLVDLIENWVIASGTDSGQKWGQSLPLWVAVSQRAGGKSLTQLEGSEQMNERRALKQPARTGAALISLICLVPFSFLMVLPVAARSSEYQAWQAQPTDQDAVKLNVDLVVLHATVQNSRRVFVFR